MPATQILNLEPNQNDFANNSTKKKEKNGESGDFLKLLLAASDDLENANLEFNLDNTNLFLKNQEKEILPKIDLKEAKTSLLENTDFLEILSLLDNLNEGKNNNISSLSNSLENLMLTQKNIGEIKSAKNILELLKIAQNLDLNLTKYEFTSEDLQNLKNDFKALDEKKFFDIDIFNFDENIKNKIQNQISQNKENLPSLDKLLRGENLSLDGNLIPKENKKEKNINNEIKLEDLLKVSKKIKPKNEKTVLDLENKITKTEKNKNASLEDYLNALTKKANEELSQSANILENDFTDFKEAQNSDLELRNKNFTNNLIKNSVLNSKFELKNISQTSQSFANDLIEKVKEYKPPISRFSMTLNPSELGEINVTMIHRANNLHININSSNQTMQVLFAAQNEVKANLINMGFSGVEMNFNSNGQNQNQNSKNQQKNKNSYEIFDEDSLSQNPEINMEIILPRYV